MVAMVQLKSIANPLALQFSVKMTNFYVNLTKFQAPDFAKDSAKDFAKVFAKDFAKDSAKGLQWYT